MRKKLLISALLISLTTITFASESSRGINQWLESQMQSHSNTPVSFILLLIGGFLASLLPCTYPLYPITINIIKRRSGNNNRFAHPLAYYSGVVIIYFIFGIIAAITGGSFNQILRLPLSNLILGLLIFLMGLSSIELLMIPLFSGTSGDAKSKGLFGTFSMGMGAGLLASACVGPIVVSILLTIASSTETVSFQIIMASALKMLLFGIGLGIPFFLLGIAGASLPKAGKWMKWVQYFIALFIFYFSYYFIEKALLGFNFTENQSIMIFISSLVFIFSYFWLIKGELLPHERMRKSLLLFSAVTSIIVLFSQFMPAVVSSNNDTITVSNSIEQKGNLKWYLNKQDAYAEAANTGKKVFVDFHADWCTNCKAFQKLTQNNEQLNKALQEVILLKVYDTAPLFEVYKSDKRFPELKIGLPFFLITDSKENLIFKTNDYTQTENMILFLGN